MSTYTYIFVYVYIYIHDIYSLVYALSILRELSGVDMYFYNFSRKSVFHF